MPKKLTEKQKARRDLQKEKRKIKREADRKARDDLKQKWNDLVKEMFQRDQGRCVFCHAIVDPKHYQTCHIIPWEFEELRYDINNVLLGCYCHHKVGRYSMHMNPLWLANWLRENRPQQFFYLMAFIMQDEKKPEIVFKNSQNCDLQAQG